MIINEKMISEVKLRLNQLSSLSSMVQTSQDDLVKIPISHFKEILFNSTELSTEKYLISIDRQKTFCESLGEDSSIVINSGWQPTPLYLSYGLKAHSLGKQQTIEYMKDEFRFSRLIENLDENQIANLENTLNHIKNDVLEVKENRKYAYLHSVTTDVCNALTNTITAHLFSSIGSAIDNADAALISKLDHENLKDLFNIELKTDVKLIDSLISTWKISMLNKSYNKVKQTELKTAHSWTHLYSTAQINNINEDINTARRNIEIICHGKI